MSRCPRPLGSNELRGGATYDEGIKCHRLRVIDFCCVRSGARNHLYRTRLSALARARHGEFEDSPPR